jgi:hypothetical protein
LGKSNIRLTKDFGDKRWRKRNLNVKSTTPSEASNLKQKKRRRKSYLQFEKGELVGVNGRTDKPVKIS